MHPSLGLIRHPYACLCTLILLALPFLPARAQSAPPDILLGRWTGVITQKKGGYRPSYEMTMTFERVGDDLRGTSFVRVDDIHAQMSFVAKMVSRDKVYFLETDIHKATRVEAMDWCLKNGRLRLIKRSGQWCLEGQWEGVSGFGPCIPGRILLKKVGERA